MKILHIITSLNIGGAETVLFRLTTGDKKNTHHVISLTDKGEYGLRLRDAGIAVNILNMPRARINFKVIFRLYRLIRAIQPDIIQTWLYHADLLGGFLGRLAGTHAIFWGIRSSNLNKHETARSTLLIRWLCAQTSRTIPSKIIINSINGQKVHVNLGYDKTKMVLIHNGVDTENLKPDKKLGLGFRAKEKIDPRHIVFGMVGRWHPQKNYGNLIDAFALLKHSGICDWRCLLVGQGMTEENAELLRLLNAQGLREDFALLGPRGDIPTIMNALDIHILSSNFGEGFPNVLAEAMACGTPCVTTDVGDAAMIVGETGWVVPHSNSTILAKVLQESIEAMKCSAGWEARREACRYRIVQNFSLKEMVELYREIWNDARTI